MANGGVNQRQADQTQWAMSLRLEVRLAQAQAGLPLHRAFASAQLWSCSSSP
jgi:hypothetical protein